MRRPLIIALVLALASPIAAPARAAGPEVKSKPVIKADKSYFDVKTGLHVLEGNVLIGFRGQKLTAGRAKANLGTMEIWGGGGVTYTVEDMFLAAEAVRIISARSRALIDGNVAFTRGELSIRADKAELDWEKKQARFTGNVRLARGAEKLAADNLLYDIAANTWQ